MSPDPKRYTIGKLADLFEIPADRLDDFLVDLKKWHGAFSATYDLVKAVADAAGEKVPENSITMVWIDDGKHEGKIIIEEKKK